MGRLVRLLEAAVAEPERAIGSLDILAPDERRTILQDWNDTARAIPAATLPELFAAQAARTPDAAAVVFEDAAPELRELDARANQLAHHLRALGVGPETVVGLCVERSPAMLVGLLGILKAGGAYLPLDPDYPPERLAFMLEDAGAPVLVTHSALLDRLPAARRTRRAARCRLAHDRAAAHDRAGQSLRSASPRLCHLHVGLHRNPEGRGGRPRRLCQQARGRRDRTSPYAGRLLLLRCSSPAPSTSICETVLPLLGGGAAVVVSAMRSASTRRSSGSR